MVERQRDGGSARFIEPMSSVKLVVGAGTEAVAEEKRLAKSVAVLPLLLLVLVVPLPELVLTVNGGGGGMYCSIPAAEFSGSER